MSFSYPPGFEIDYPPEALDSFYVDGFEYIDNLNFARNAREYLKTSPYCDDYIQKDGKIFKQNGWRGDGEIQLIWLPPFLFGSFGLTRGVVIWHVKQEADGISWIMSPIRIPYDVIQLDGEEAARIEKLHGSNKVG